jgi:nucleoside-diphosphate-sugar epimerase
MRTVVIGGTGHVGTYLCPRLVEAGHDVVAVSRGRREPYRSHGAWDSVELVELDREAREADGTFGDEIASLEPDVVVDMICFERDQAEHLVESLEGEVRQYLNCGTIWVHGPTAVAPTPVEHNRNPIGEYGRGKAAIESYLLDRARRDGFPATVIHPGHIVGPGWVPVNPAGNFELDVFERLARGEPVTLPNLGMETLHHVHADDVAGLFQAAVENWGAAVGEAFHAVSPAAVTLRGYADRVAGWYGETAELSFEPFEAWRESVDAEAAETTHEHILHSPNCAAEKAARELGFRPRHSSLESVREALEWLESAGRLET